MDIIEKIVIIILILLFVMLATAVGFAVYQLVKPDAIQQGEIIEMEFKPAYSETRIMPVIISNGKTTSTMMIPYVYHYPDRYWILIKGIHDGEIVTEDFYVTKEVYFQLSIGAEFIYQKGRDMTDEPYTREKESRHE